MVKSISFLAILTPVLLFAGSNFSLAAFAPAITSFSPSDGASPGQMVSITGTDFSPTSNLLTFDQDNTTKSSLTAPSSSGPGGTFLISFALPSNLNVGSVKITITANGLSGQSNYTVKAVPALSVGGVNPTPLPANIPYFEISGSGFTPGSYRLQFTNVVNTPNLGNITFVSPNLLRVNTSPWPSFLEGTKTGKTYPAVLIFGQQRGNVALTVVLPQPAIISVSPQAEEPGKEITISGANFQPGALENKVYLLDGQLVPFVLIPKSATAQEIKVNLPALSELPESFLGPDKGVKIYVLTSFNGGTPSGTLPFTIIAPPVFNSISPSSGIVGASVVIEGKYFKSIPGENNVVFTNKTTGNISGPVVQSASQNRLEFKLHDITPGKYSVRVETFWFGSWRFNPASQNKEFEVVKPTLSVQLSATVAKNDPPAARVRLTATVSGSSEGTVNYTFWWNCNNPSNNVQQAIAACGNPNNPSVGAKLDNQKISTLLVYDDYKNGNYTAKVIVEKGSLAAQSQAPINITLPVGSSGGITPPQTTPSSPAPVNSPPTGTAGGSAPAGSPMILSWAADTLAARYFWNVSEAETGEQVDSGMSEETTAQTNVPLKPATTYILRVSGCNDQNCWPLTEQYFTTAGQSTTQPTQPSSPGQSGSSPGASSGAGSSVNLPGSGGCPSRTGPTDPNAIVNPLCAENIQDLINQIARWIFLIALAIAPVMVVIAGVYYATSGGNPERITTARRIILYTGIGLLVIFLSRVLISVIRGALG